MKLWIDTEFNEYRGALISLALVAENGSYWYGVRYCDDPGWWVREHVIPHLNKDPERDASLRESLDCFLRSFEHIHIVSDWPGDIAHFCNFLEWAPGERIGPDRITFEVRRDLPDTAKTSKIPHNALEDARALAASSPADALDAQERALAEIREVWAGAECGEPVTAQEAYAIHLCKQMYQIACDALAGKTPAPDAQEAMIKELQEVGVGLTRGHVGLINSLGHAHARIKALEDALRDYACGCVGDECMNRDEPVCRSGRARAALEGK